jgi:hypothetical protein
VLAPQVVQFGRILWCTQAVVLLPQKKTAKENNFFPLFIFISNFFLFF